MATITLKGNPIQTIGTLPEVGAEAPAFSLTRTDLSGATLEDFAGCALVLNIVPSIDTGVCAMSARAFNAQATEYEGVKVLTISEDLPFAHGRFCAAEGIDAVVMLSTMRETVQEGPAFGEAYGVRIMDGPLAGLLSRAVVVLDAAHRVVYTEQVPEIAQEPDYEAALAALRS